MTKYQNKYRIESIRLPNYDYSQPGAYFITICTHNKIHYFGEIIDGKMELNVYGGIVKQCWKEIPEHFPNVSLDYFVIMPNHIHGILIINDNLSNVETKNLSSQQIQNKFHSPSKTIGSAIRGFKIGVTKLVRQKTKNLKIWQRNYYEHIIRNDKSLYDIRYYIQNNPLNWENDEYNIH